MMSIWHGAHTVDYELDNYGNSPFGSYLYVLILKRPLTLSPFSSHSPTVMIFHSISSSFRLRSCAPCFHISSFHNIYSLDFNNKTHFSIKSFNSMISWFSLWMYSKLHSIMPTFSSIWPFSTSSSLSVKWKYYNSDCQEYENVDNYHDQFDCIFVEYLGVTSP